jgi:hypothetical protein
VGGAVAVAVAVAVVVAVVVAVARARVVWWWWWQWYSRYIACFLQIYQQPILPALPFSLCDTLSEDWWCLVLCPESAHEKLSM